MTSSPAQLQDQINQLKNRNTRVDADKAWERSYTRIGSICFITYLTAATLLYCLGSKHPFWDACVPVVGFFLSTQSLPAIKTRWVRHYLKIQIEQPHPGHKTAETRE